MRDTVVIPQMLPTRWFCNVLSPAALCGIYLWINYLDLRQTLQPMQYGGSIYILTNHNYSVLYLGVTSNLVARINEHKNKVYPDSFTSKYNCYKLVYYDSFSRIEEAIAKEKIIKKWKKEWKENLINQMNPSWNDLSDTL